MSGQYAVWYSRVDMILSLQKKKGYCLKRFQTETELMDFIYEKIEDGFLVG